MAYPQQVFVSTTFSSPSFISRRRQVVYENTLLYQLNVLKKTGRYEAFKLKWHPSYSDKPNVWPVPNHLFWDSDVAKWIEGACYFLRGKDNAEIDAAVKELVEMIRSAQQEDGYLNIHFTVVDPKGRFTNLRDLHELYNAGHLIEAALAHQEYYGNDLFLQPILKYVDLLCRTFGPGPDQKHGYPGHPEIELALLRLFGKTKDTRHRALAQYFIEERGNPHGQDGRHYYDVEAELRGEGEHERPAYWTEERSFWYQQAHKPIIEQETIEGHSVRAMYLLTAVADLVRIDNTGNNTGALGNALARLWTNMVDKKMYLTGGIGAMKQWEGFGIDYFLPSGTDEGGCYAETCAGIGVMMLAERMLQLDLDVKFADVMELCFYNAVLTGMSANGKQFTYVNQLASTDTDLSKRAEWFTCACCPPNMARLLGYIGGYLWSQKTDENSKSVEVAVHLYSSATIKIPVGDTTVELEQKSNWPWDGKIDFTIRNASKVATTIKLRVPGWATDWKLSPSAPETVLEKGYLTLSPDWLKKHDTFELDIPLKPRFITPHTYTNQDVVALARGPLIYCLEDFDNPWVEDHFKSLVLDSTGNITEEVTSDSALGEPCITLTAHNSASFLGVEESLGPLVPLGKATVKERPAVQQLMFIPYCLRDNRGGKGHMRKALCPTEFSVALRYKILPAAFLSPVFITGTLAATAAVVNFANDTGAPEHLASGTLYGLPENGNQIPDEFFRDIGWRYERAGGAQLPAPALGWIWGLTNYKNRFKSALSNYQTTLKHGGQFVFLIHDLWGADGTQNSSAPYPGDNGDWTSWDSYLATLFSDMNANDMTKDVIVDIWNEPDLAAFWARTQQQYLEMWGRTYYKFRAEFGTKVLLSGPASAGEPLNNSWFANWCSYISRNGSIPDQYAWHMEGGGGDLLSAHAGLLGYLEEYNLPTRAININEYGVFKEQVPSGSAWWIAQLERINAFGLRGNWLSGYQLHDFMASLIGKPDSLSNYSATSTGYFPVGDYQVYKYYNLNMTGSRYGTTPSSDLALDVYATADRGLARVLVGVRVKTGTWQLTLDSLTSLGLAASGSLDVHTFAFPAVEQYQQWAKVDSPIDLGWYSHPYSDGSVTFPINQVTTDTAFAFEFAY